MSARRSNISHEPESRIGAACPKGSGPAITDLVGGHLHVSSLGFPGAMPFVKSGRLRPIAVTSAKLTGLIVLMMPLVLVPTTAGTGSEVMRRIAAPMVGGMISSTILTLAVIPAIYALVKSRAVTAPAPN